MNERGPFYHLQFLEETREIFASDPDIMLAYIFQPGLKNHFKTTIISISRIKSYITGKRVPGIFNLEWDSERYGRDSKVFRWDDINSAESIIISIANEADLNQIISGKWQLVYIKESDMLCIPDIIANQLLDGLKSESLCDKSETVTKEFNENINREKYTYTFSINNGTVCISVFTNLLETGFIEKTSISINIDNGRKTPSFTITGFTDLLFYPITILPELCKILKNALS